MKSFVLGLVASLFLVVSVDAQDYRMKWGDVPLEDVQMTSFEADSNAQAVILGEFGEVEVDVRGRVMYRYHLRVKLLSEAAYDDWGTYALSYWDGSYPQRISKVQGNTFVLGQDGKVVRHKLGKKEIFKENVADNVKQLRFTLPALEPGAVVEYRYSMSTENPVYLPDWDFQHSEPTRYSEYKATIANYFGYVQVNSVPRFDVETKEEVIGPEGNSMQYRWGVKDMPALREEPYITTLEDYKAKIEFQLSSFDFPGTPRETFLSTWEELAEELRKESDFWGAMKAGKRVRALAEEITAGITDPHEKMHALHNYVRSNITWTGEYGVYAGNKLDNIVKDGSASVGGQTLLLIAMLRSVGIESYPVVLSTRSNGAITRLHPLLTQFDYVIANASIGGKDYFLDSTNPLAPSDLLPLRALNGLGWLIGDDAEKWISLNSSSKYVQLVRMEGALDEFGRLEGKLSASTDGYGALAIRSMLNEGGERDKVGNELLEELDGMEISGVQIENEGDLEKPLSMSAELALDGFAQQAGDFLYVNPHALSRINENPLRLEERAFPVDLGYAYDWVYSIQLQLPEGYEVQESLKDTRMVLPDKGGMFQRSTQISEDKLVMQTRFTLSKSKYSPNMYKNLRELYDRVVAAEAEQIVLMRAGEE